MKEIIEKAFQEREARLRERDELMKIVKEYCKVKETVNGFSFRVRGWGYRWYDVYFDEESYAVRQNGNMTHRFFGKIDLMRFIAKVIVDR
jgi:hypothetical protein